MSGADWDGLAALPGRLTTAGEALGRAAADRAAETIARVAARLAPGRLGQGIRHETTAEGGQIAMPGFARFVEFGTRKTAARPFLRPAIERARAEGVTAEKGGDDGGGGTGNPEGAL